MSQRPKVVPPGFQILDFVGEGGSGEVYRARQLSVDREVALKLLPENSKLSMPDLSRFLTEARSASRLDSPNIVKTYDAGFAAGRPFLVMEFCPAGTLRERIRAVSSVDASGVAQSVETMITLANTLAALHGVGVIHRDLKPSNVLFGQDGQPKIADFGIARMEGEEPVTLTGEVVGTWAYMAPELLDHQVVGQASARTDVYALGVTLYELLTGIRPFQGQGLELQRAILKSQPTPPGRINPRVTHDLELICLKAMHRDPAERYATALDFARDLESYRADRPITARRPTWLYRCRKLVLRHPVAAILVAVVGFIAVLGAAKVWRDMERIREQVARLHSLARRDFADRRYADAVLNLKSAEALVGSRPWGFAAESRAITADLALFAKTTDAEATWLKFVDARQRALSLRPPSSRTEQITQIRTFDEALEVFDALSPRWQQDSAVQALLEERRSLLLDQVDELAGRYLDACRGNNLRILALNGGRVFVANKGRFVPEISNVAEGSIFARLGIQAGDRLLRVDGRPGFSLTEEQLTQLAADPKEFGRVYEFISQGQVVKVELSDAAESIGPLNLLQVDHVFVVGSDAQSADAGLQAGDVFLALDEWSGNDGLRGADGRIFVLAAFEDWLSRRRSSPIKAWVQHDDGSDAFVELGWTLQDAHFVHDRQVALLSHRMRMECGGLIHATRSGSDKMRANYAVTDRSASLPDLFRQSFHGGEGWPLDLVDESFSRTGLSDSPQLLAAMEAAAKGDCDEALETVEKHLDVHPTNAEARLLQIACCVQTAKWGRLVQVTTEYLQLRPAEPVPRYWRAEALAELKEPALAIKDLELIRTQRPEFLPAKTLLEKLNQPATTSDSVQEKGD